MILRYTSEQLRKLAEQTDAYTAIAAAGGKHPESKILEIDGQQMAYLFWWEDRQRYLVEFLDFNPDSKNKD